jgi:hypothetical protein
MKIVVTHISPDWDAISSVWLIKKYLPGWQEATVAYVPAGERFRNIPLNPKNVAQNDPIERAGDDEIIHVDTGLGPLDHHQTQDTNVCGASRTWEYVQKTLKKSGDSFTSEHRQAVSRIIKVIVDIDHFREVFWEDAASDRYEFSLIGLLEGMKYLKPDQDSVYLQFGIASLEAMVAEFENRIWAEKEIAEKGIKFETRFGPGMGFETINDTVLKLSQKMGYCLVVRRDPRKNYVRIKTLPEQPGKKGADLTLAYEELKKIDPDATWFLHVSKKMLLNGSPKNPKMRPTKLGLRDIIKVLERI